MRSRWKWGGRVCAALALGALTTVGVSWGLSFTDVRMGGKVAFLDSNGSPVSSGHGLDVLVSRSRTTLYVDAEYVGEMYANVPGIPLVVAPRTTQPLAELLPTWAMREGVPWILGAAPAPRGADIDARTLLARGFPFVAMYSTIERGMATGNVVHGGLRVPGQQIMHHQMIFMQPLDVILPLRPVWPGFAANSVIYAAAWMMIILTAALPRAVRRRRRRRAGRCESCGYDMKGTPSGCPECGVTARAGVADA